ncbi:murein biosynthesis integral membrane protein MurJ [Dermatophilus congolensis]|uniref:Integral membrane protein MviN n=1 Tax=Dermatophilus congolensis TaxID=1863 RepID=A0A239VA45_9MICO|nr:murein biosynthesis integral membrane protein MurJ [Dermatophilus congolensis]MBO3130492.1 murein biosynthesis integral membrane protein MurJ [Dermatophilus congolensis]MBO3130878.1 murein biosynthesis integral membrane protein MurJ [Dermatophilus congolensis]MBO3134964.1 murein biosynthesis integral membrane protein MurJ [Dermatophilus congolensis]MBO3137203.1 murein biosynthesis integral membrane protein MurJ [Dermatophilus congolensis]MBO3139446.1 murein biosynthesis integral membrane pr
MSSSNGSLARASALMASGSLVSRVLGLARQSMILAVFGLTLAGDSWAVANMLPNTIYTLLAGGVINAVLVPQIAAAQKNPDGGQEYLDKLITLSILVLLGVTAICIPLIPFLVNLLSSANWDEPTYGLSVAFSYICMPAIFFYGLYAILGQVLNAREKFGWFMWSPVLCNIVWIVALGWFINAYGRGNGDPTTFTPAMIALLGGSLTLGVALQAIVLIWPLHRSGFRYRPRFGFRGVGLGAVGRVAGWTFASLAVAQLGLIIQTRVLTSVAQYYPGKIAYDQAFLLFMTPHGLITVSLATALFTSMAKAVAIDDRDTIRSDLRRGANLIGVTTIPIAFGTLAIGTALTGLIFLGNSREATDAIGYLTMAMMLGLPAYGVYYLCQRAFLAHSDARTPFRMQVLNTSIGTVLTIAALVLTDEWRGVAAAGAQAIANIISAIIATMWVQQRMGRLRMYRITRTWVRVIVACIPATLASYAAFLAIENIIPIRALESTLKVTLGAAIFIPIYLIGAHRMRIDEVKQITQLITTRLPKRKPTHGPA